MRRSLVAAMIALVLLAWPAHAQTPAGPGVWLDGPITNWNARGMAVMKPPAYLWGAVSTDVCPNEPQTLETPEGQVLGAAGWYRVSEVATGWGVKLLYGQQGVDGMCRASGYQFFVFVDGLLAGTVSPHLMGARLDGDGDIVAFGRDGVLVEYIRYGANDPLCCPSKSPSRLWFKIDRAGSGPLLVPQQ